MSPTAWTQAADNAHTEHYIAQLRTRSVKPRAVQAMVTCMRVDLRIKKRTWLREAQFICLGFDDKNGRKLLRFKCDEPTGPACFAAAALGVDLHPPAMQWGGSIKKSMKN